MSLVRFAVLIVSLSCVLAWSNGQQQDCSRLKRLRKGCCTVPIARKLMGELKVEECKAEMKRLRKSNRNERQEEHNHSNQSEGGHRNCNGRQGAHKRERMFTCGVECAFRTKQWLIDGEFNVDAITEQVNGNLLNSSSEWEGKAASIVSECVEFVKSTPQVAVAENCTSGAAQLVICIHTKAYFSCPRWNEETERKKEKCGALMRHYESCKGEYHSKGFHPHGPGHHGPHGHHGHHGHPGRGNGTSTTPSSSDSTTETSDDTDVSSNDTSSGPMDEESE